MSTSITPIPPDVPPQAARKVRVAYFVSHPIQYQAPLLRCVSDQPDIDLSVFFFSDFSTRSYVDAGFGVAVQWDIPLLEGYRHEFLPTIRDRGRLGFADPICRGIWKTLKDGQFDVVWLHGYHTLNHLHVLVAAKALGIPVLLRAESTLSDRPRGSLRLAAKKLFFSSLRSTVTALLPISTANVEYWNVYMPQKCQFLVPYAVDNDFFQAKTKAASSHREEFRASLGLESQRPIILFASKLQTRKRCIDLVEAYFRLYERSAENRKPYLVIVGDGEERNAVQARIGNKLGNNIIMTGFRNQSELPAFFDLCDVFVLPSVWEPFGLIVNEVMNSARPVVVSDEVGCQRDLVKHKATGMVFKAGNIDELAQALEYILETPERTHEMGRHALEHIQNFSYKQDITALKCAISHAIQNSQLA